MIDISACKCDLTFNFCDGFCCCDGECTPVLKNYNYLVNLILLGLNLRLANSRGLLFRSVRFFLFHFDKIVFF